MKVVNVVCQSSDLLASSAEHTEVEEET